jgi:uracil-DNA glycosylase
MIKFKEELLEEIRNMRKEFQEMKLLQLKLIEFMIPIVKPTKREKNVVRNTRKMKFYSLEEVKKKLKV